MSGVATVSPMAVGSVLANVGITFDADQTVNRLPGHFKVGDMVNQHVADTTHFTNDSVNHNTFVFISCNKGNTQGDNNLAKYACWYCKFDKRVKNIY